MSYLDFYTQDIEQFYMYIYTLVVTAVAEEQRSPGTGPISCMLLCPPQKILFLSLSQLGESLTCLTFRRRHLILYMMERT